MPAHLNSSLKTQRRKRLSYHFGYLAERVAAGYLRLLGYRILARRYRSSAGEIDLIGLRRHTLVAFEVKARLGAFDADVITPHQQQRIITGLSLFLAKHPKFAQYDIRFDAICLSLTGRPRHIRNAWQA